MALHFSEDYIQEIVEKNDIVDYISQSVRLKRSGSTFKGLCPFHKEKTPSFSVSPDKQLFHCFERAERSLITLCFRKTSISWRR